MWPSLPKTSFRHSFPDTPLSSRLEHFLVTISILHNFLAAAVRKWIVLFHRSPAHARVYFAPGSFLIVATPTHTHTPPPPSCSKTLTWHRDLNDLPVRRLRFNPLQRNAICWRTCGDSTVHRRPRPTDLSSWQNCVLSEIRAAKTWLEVFLQGQLRAAQL